MNRWLSRNIFWPATERLCGRNTVRRFQELQAIDRLGPKDIEAIQTQKLRRLLRHAAQNCSFYESHFRASGVNAFDPSLGLPDLANIKPITRDDIREHRNQMIAAGAHSRLIPYSTGGSTGEPLQLYIDGDRAAADWAARWRARSWWDLHPGDTEVLLWGGPSKRTFKDMLKSWRDATLNQHVLSAFDLSPASMCDYVRQLRDLKPACVYGYASSLALLARFALDEMGNNKPLHNARLKAVFATGEVLTRPDADTIARAFGVQVAQEYGCRDGGLLGCACPLGSLHVPQANVIVELLDEDGRHVPPGQSGEVTITYLETFSMPIIRYRIGDFAVYSPHACACGHASQVLDEIQGRRTDHIVRREGDTLIPMHALSLIYVVREIEGVRQFRIHQPSIDRLEVDFVPGGGFTREHEHRLLSGLLQQLGENVQVELRRRDHIPPLPSGKHVCVTSDVLPSPLFKDGLRGVRGNEKATVAAGD